MRRQEVAGAMLCMSDAKDIGAKPFGADTCVKNCGNDCFISVFGRCHCVAGMGYRPQHVLLRSTDWLTTRHMHCR